MPQPAAAPAGAVSYPAPPAFGPPGVAASPAPADGIGGAGRIKWTLTYCGFLVFVFVSITFKLRVADIAMGLALIALPVTQRRVRMPTALVWLAAITVWALLGTVTAPYGAYAMDAVTLRLKLLLIALVGANVLESRAQLRFYVLWFLVWYLAVPIRASLFSFARTGAAYGRLVGPFIYANSNDFAMITLLVMAMTLFTFELEQGRPLLKKALVCLAALFAFIVLMTQSRGVFLGMTAMVAPSIVAIGRRKPKQLLWVAVAMAIVIAAAPKGVWERVGGLTKATSSETIRNVDPEGSGADRLEILKTGWRMFSENPVFGIGLGTFTYAFADYNPELGGRDTHNTYLNVATEIGIVGFLLWIALVASVYRHVRRSRLAITDALPTYAHALRWLELGFVGFLVASCFGSYSHLTHIYLYMAFVWAASEVGKRAASGGALGGFLGGAGLAPAGGRRSR